MPDGNLYDIDEVRDCFGRYARKDILTQPLCGNNRWLK
ncbi:hypothetical protein ASZ90_007619 [hydrocarbon metagenome]|uniref:Uncharacterized protein n=1 Tax=hydrocarbon metagenome TaxID=938273 RepID=A0A0W8FNV5_9ZZZZ